ncbi:MAG: transporter substrate-binding domain-containing protein [bacterium]|nr:transporter substrate-binding domain-containing protein [bacterium]
MNDYVKALILCVLCFAILAGGKVAMGWAQQGKSYVPGVWRGDVQRPRPDFSGLAPLRVITEADYPPFNYYDEDGTLTGFNVELIQAICGVLGVTCSVEARDWEFLLPSLGRKEVDIVAASITISSDSLKTADFTDHYYETPARFVVAKGDDLAEITPEALKGKTVGVIAGSSHQAYLQKYYYGVKLTLVERRDELRKMLLEGKVKVIFDDGITSVFWLNGTLSKACCAFSGGPIIDQKYFGEGVGFAVQKGNRRLREMLNYALEKVRRDGIYEELFLRYFPLSFY